jgi:uncharacterized membrane protein YfcA
VSGTSGTCAHKPLFPMILLDYVGSIYIIFFTILANSGGLGGGGTMIPTAVAFFFFDTKNAIYVSNASIFFSALIRYFMNSQKPHPLKNGKGILVDYNYAVLMLPFVVIGSAIGTIINGIVPDVVIVAALTAVLLVLFITT